MLLTLYFFFMLDMSQTTKYTHAKSLRLIRSPEVPQKMVNELFVKSASKEKLIETDAEPLSSCESPGCIRTAAEVRNYLNESVDPCDNFYQFASGNYINNGTVPYDNESTDLYETISDLVQLQLHGILNEPPQANDSKQIRLVKSFNMACLNETASEKRGINPLLEMLDSLGGWPVLERSSWSDNDWNWIGVIKKFRRIGLDTAVIFSLSVESDLRNSTRRVLEVN